MLRFQQIYAAIYYQYSSERYWEEIEKDNNLPKKSLKHDYKARLRNTQANQPQSPGNIHIPICLCAGWQPLLTTGV